MHIVPMLVMTKDNIQEVADKTGRNGGDLTKMLIQSYAATGWPRLKVPQLLSFDRR